MCALRDTASGILQPCLLVMLWNLCMCTLMERAEHLSIKLWQIQDPFFFQFNSIFAFFKSTVVFKQVQKLRVSAFPTRTQDALNERTFQFPIDVREGNICLQITCETRSSNLYSELSQIQLSREAKSAFPLLNAPGQIFSTSKGMFLCLYF